MDFKYIIFFAFSSILVFKNSLGILNQTIIDITNMGAIPNDNLDDSAAIVKAFNLPGNNVIYFPSGIYEVDSTIEVPSNLSLEGDGVSSVIRRNKFLTHMPIFKYEDKDNISINNLNFVGGLYVSTGDSHPGDCILIKNSRNIKITNSTFKRCTYAGIGLYGNTHHVEISKNNFDDIYMAIGMSKQYLNELLYPSGPSFVKILNNTISNTHTEGIDINEGAQEIVIAQNSFKDIYIRPHDWSHKECIDIQEVKSIVVTQNTFDLSLKGYDTMGVHLKAKVEKATISQNAFIGGARSTHAILVGASREVTISNNIIMGWNNGITFHSIGGHSFPEALQGNVVIQGNKISNIRNSGIFWMSSILLFNERSHYAVNINISSNLIDGTLNDLPSAIGNGIYLEKTKNLVISGNEIFGFLNNGILLPDGLYSLEGIYSPRSSQNHVINTNNIHHNSNAGIKTGIEKSVISTNLIHDNTKFGIIITANYGVMLNNILNKNLEQGILMGVHCDYMNLISNSVSGSQIGLRRHSNCNGINLNVVQNILTDNVSNTGGMINY